MTDATMEGFPVALRWPIAWGDMDAYGHVNNAAYFRWFESVRICYFSAIGWIPTLAEAQVGPILAHTSCTYRTPLAYPDTVLLGATVGEVLGDRFTMRYQVVSERLGTVAAHGEGRVVAFDYGAGHKAPLPVDVVDAIRRLQGA